MVHKLGYGNWDELKAAFRTSPLFRFDWFVKSRTTQELARRCDTLIRLVEKENQEYDERERQARKEKKLAKVGYLYSNFCKPHRTYILFVCAVCTTLKLHQPTFSHHMHLFIWILQFYFLIKPVFVHLNCNILYWFDNMYFRAWHHQSALLLGKRKAPFPKRSGNNWLWTTMWARCVTAPTLYLNMW